MTTPIQTPVIATSGSVAAATATATLAAPAGAASGQRVWIEGFQVTASGATAGLPVQVTVTGVATNPLVYIFTFPAGVLVAAQPLAVAFVPPLPAVADGTSIVVSCPSGGAGNTNAAVNAQGFVG